MARDSIYQHDVAWIHHVGFGDFSRRAAPGLLRLIRGAGIRRGRLIDLGCGSGLWAAAAARAGFTVIGVDGSRAMIRLARQAAPAARFLHASLYDVRIPACDAVTAIGESLSYLEPGNLRRSGLGRLLGRIAHALRPGGLFIFDVLVSGGPPLDGRHWRAGRDWVVLAEAREQPAQKRLTRRIVSFRRIGRHWRRAGETHRIRLFERGEVERALRKAGFVVRVVQRYGRERLLPRRRAFIARKPG
jgi:SAM-dependent methyltransferase